MMFHLMQIDIIGTVSLHLWGLLLHCARNLKLCSLVCVPVKQVLHKFDDISSPAKPFQNYVFNILEVERHNAIRG